MGTLCRLRQKGKGSGKVKGKFDEKGKGKTFQKGKGKGKGKTQSPLKPLDDRAPDMERTAEYVRSLQYPRVQALDRMQSGLVEELQRATDEEDKWPLASRASQFLARTCHQVMMEKGRVDPETKVPMATNEIYWAVRHELVGDHRQWRTR